MIENGLKTIRQVFDGTRFFAVPSYQRAYAWDEKQLRDFLEDIRNQVDDKSYFMGTLLFQDGGRDGDFDVIYVVDGQQRLTTLVIFLKSLIDVLERRNSTLVSRKHRIIYIEDEGIPKFRTIPDDNTFFKDYILKEMEPIKWITPSQKRLLESKKFLKKEIGELTTEELEKYLIRIEKTNVLTYSVSGNAEATLIFETTNDRGKRLTNLESIKSFLMHKIYLSSDHPETLLSSIQGRFSEIYRTYERIENDNTMKEDEILRYHFIAFCEWKGSEYSDPKEAIKDHINRLFKEDKTKVISYIEKFSRELKESFEIMERLLMNMEKIEALDDLYCMNRIANFYPLLLKVYKYDNTRDKKHFAKVARLCEIFAFRAYEIANKRSDTGSTAFYAMARGFNDENDFLKTTDNLRKASTEWWNLDGLFKKGLNNPYIYYERGGAQYWLWKYENYLRTEEGPKYFKVLRDEYLSSDEKTRLSIEHIASQKTDDYSYQLEINVDDDFKQKCLHSIGNLVIDSKSANSSKGNNPYFIKEKTYKNAPLLSQNEIPQFIISNTWDKNAIEKRAEKLINFALKNWDPKNV